MKSGPRNIDGPNAMRGPPPPPGPPPGPPGPPPGPPGPPKPGPAPRGPPPGPPGPPPGPPGPPGPPKPPPGPPLGSIASHCSGVKVRWIVQTEVRSNSSVALCGAGRAAGEDFSSAAQVI